MRLLRREGEDACTEVVTACRLGRESRDASGRDAHEHDTEIRVQLAVDRVAVAGADHVSAPLVREAVEALLVDAVFGGREAVAQERVHLHGARQGRPADTDERLVVDDLARRAGDVRGDIGRYVQRHVDLFEVSASRRTSAITSDSPGTNIRNG